MNTVIYVAEITGDDLSGYIAKFPDLPSLAIRASTMAQLLRDARTSLLRELANRENSGEDWPEPTSTAMLREGVATGALLMLIDVQVDDTPIRVNISIGERLLQRLDEAAGAQDMSRSGFIAAAVRRQLEYMAGVEVSSQRLYDEVASVARHVTDAIGPSSTFGRAIAELDQRAIDGLRSITSMIGKGARRTEKED
ncbi:MAG: type II toxin-antitoxin system HicB family antitoxin [Caulobacteraceae bacterium]